MRATGSNQTLTKYSEHPHDDSDVERNTFDEVIAQTLQQEDMLVAKKQEALEMANRNV